MQRSFFFTTLCLLLASSAFAYDMPVGIPDIGLWGSVDPIETPAPETATACPNWPSAADGGCYYIDNTDPNATDTSNDRGYPDKPRMTVPEITYSAGSYVEVHGGPYIENYTNVSLQGTSSNPCWFRGTPSSMPVFPTALTFNDSSYLIIEYLDFNGGDSSNNGLSIQKNGDHIAVRNSQFRNCVFYPGANSSGISIKPDTGDIIHDVLVYNCNFENLGDWKEDSVDTDFHGVTPNLWGRDSTTEEYNIWILSNTAYHISGNLVQVNAANWTDSYQYLHHIYIGRNVAHTLRQAGFWSKEGSDIIMSENSVYDNRKHGSQMGDCFGYQYRPNNLWIIYNTCTDVNFGVRGSDYSFGDVNAISYIVGNKFYGIYPVTLVGYDPNDPWRTGVGISLWTGGMSRYVVDNVIYNTQNGINAIQSSGGSNLEMIGNIISNVTNDGWHYFIHQNVVADSHIDYSLMYSFATDARINWDYNEYTSLASFKAAVPGECVNCPSEADPLFIDPTAHNFNLQSGSPAIPLQGQSDVYTKFQTLYGLDIHPDQVSQVCNNTHLYLCNSQLTCEAAQGSWVDGACQLGEYVCDIDHPYRCMSQVGCEAVGATWDHTHNVCIACGEVNYGLCTDEDTCTRSAATWTGTGCIGCSPEHINLCAISNACTSNGGNWCDGVCQVSACGSSCDSAHVDVCADQLSCESAGGNWCNNNCQIAACNAVCDSDHVLACLDQYSCEVSGGNWCTDTCQTEACSGATARIINCAISGTIQ